MRKKSIKKHIEVGSIVERFGDYYVVTNLLKNKFQAQLITDDEDWSWMPTFSYNTDMKVFKMVAKNY